MIAVLLFIVVDTKAQDLVFEVIGKISPQTGNGGSNSGTPLGDPWANSDAGKRREAIRDEARRIFDGNMAAINNKAQDYQDNSKKIADVISGPAKTKETQDCPRLKKCYNECLGEITSLNNHVNKLMSLKNPNRDYDVYNQTLNELRSCEASYDKLGKLTSVANATEKLYNTQNEIATLTKQEVAKRDKIYDQRIALQEKLLTQAMREYYATVPLTVGGTGAIIVKSLADYTADVFLTELPQVKPIYVYTQTFWESYVDKHIIEGSPITAKMLNDINNQAVFRAEMALTPLTDEFEDLYGSKEAAEKLVNFFSNQAVVIRLQGQVIDDLTESIARTKKLKKLNLEQNEITLKGINLYLQSIDVPPKILQFRPILINKDELNDNYEPFVEIRSFNSFGPIPVFSRLEFNKVKERSNLMFNLAAKNVNDLKSTDCVLYPIFKKYRDLANQDFNVVLKLNADVQKYPGTSMAIDPNWIESTGGFIPSFLIIKRTFIKANNNLLRLRLCQDLFTDTGNVFQKIVNITKARDEYYERLFNKTSKYTNSVTSKKNNRSLAEEKTLALINTYFDYSGRDLLTVPFVKLSKQGLIAANNDDLTEGFVSRYLTDAVDKEASNTSEILLSLFMRLEKAYLLKQKVLKGTAQTDTINFLQGDDVKKSSTNLREQIKKFKALKENHKLIFNLMESGKYNFLQGI